MTLNQFCYLLIYLLIRVYCKINTVTQTTTLVFAMA